MHREEPGIKGLIDHLLQLCGVLLHSATGAILEKIAARPVNGEYPNHSTLHHGVQITKMRHDAKAFESGGGACRRPWGDGLAVA